MEISVNIPKDLSCIKTKVALGLTKRQLLCFSLAALCGVPVYFLTKGIIGTSASSVIMVAIMVPFFIVALYERDGFPAERILYFMVTQKYLTKGIRPYKSENIYTKLKRIEKIREEVRSLEGRKLKPDTKN